MNDSLHESGNVERSALYKNRTTPSWNSSGRCLSCPIHIDSRSLRILYSLELVRRIVSSAGPLWMLVRWQIVRWREKEVDRRSCQYGAEGMSARVEGSVDRTAAPTGGQVGSGFSSCGLNREEGMHGCADAKWIVDMGNCHG